MAKRTTPMKKIPDTVVIYHSTEDGCWIAHSLRTDQIGTGTRIVDALADVIRAVDQVCAEAAADGSLAILREAPPEVQEILKTAKKLPGEIHDIAYKMVHGEWPKELDPDIKAGDEQSFQTDLDPAVA